jgi:hypothetical protein
VSLPLLIGVALLVTTGVLVSLRARRHNADARRGFREMNQALKLRAEQRQLSEGATVTM